MHGKDPIMSTADISSDLSALLHPPRHYNAAVDLIERNLRRGLHDKVAYVDDAGSYSYGELAARVDRCASALRDLEIQVEQRVVLCLTDTIDFPTAFLGCIKAGVIPVAVNTLLTPADIAYILEDSRATVALVSSQLLPALASTFAKADRLRHLIVTAGEADGCLSFQDLLARAHPRAEAAPTTCDDACFWLYSSGSTGAPKGTVHVHSSLIQTADLYARQVAGICESDVVFSVSKLPFAYGLGNSLSFPLAVGATAVLMAERPTPAAVVQRMLRHQPTVLCSIPTSFAALLAFPELPRREQLRLRCCISAGEALPEEIGRRWHERFGVPILDGIGSTEMLHIFLSNRAHDIRYGTTGTPVPGYEVRIVDAAGVPVPTGEVGELQIRGPTRALLYWNQRQRSSETFQGEWVRSGDQFRQRADGCYVYEGRSDDMLKVGGLFVSPVEVESILVAHDAVLEAAVVGRQDAEGLVKPCAFVVLKPGRTADSKDLQQHVKSRLAPYKYPRWIEFIPELPKTATGKIQRFKLRQQVAAHEPAGAS
jgi:benzoate-CoA ligase